MFWGIKFTDSNMSMVRYAFAGVPLLTKEEISIEEYNYSTMTSDILFVLCVVDIVDIIYRNIRHEIPEFIATIHAINSSFALTQTSDPYWQLMTARKRALTHLLKRASEQLRLHAGESAVDAIHMTVRFSQFVVFSHLMPHRRFALYER